MIDLTDRSLLSFYSNPNDYRLRLMPEMSGKKLVAELKNSCLWGLVDFIVIRLRGVEQYQLENIVKGLENADLGVTPELQAKLQTKIDTYNKYHEKEGKVLKFEPKSQADTSQVALSVIAEPSFELRKIKQQQNLIAFHLLCKEQYKIGDRRSMFAINFSLTDNGLIEKTNAQALELTLAVKGQRHMSSKVKSPLTDEFANACVRLSKRVGDEYQEVETLTRMQKTSLLDFFRALDLFALEEGGGCENVFSLLVRRLSKNALDTLSLYGAPEKPRERDYKPQLPEIGEELAPKTLIGCSVAVLVEGNPKKEEVEDFAKRKELRALYLLPIVLFDERGLSIYLPQEFTKMLTAAQSPYVANLNQEFQRFGFHVDETQELIQPKKDVQVACSHVARIEPGKIKDFLRKVLRYDDSLFLELIGFKDVIAKLSLKLDEAFKSNNAKTCANVIEIVPLSEILELVQKQKAEVLASVIKYLNPETALRVLVKLSDELFSKILPLIELDLQLLAGLYLEYDEKDLFLEKFEKQKLLLAIMKGDALQIERFKPASDQPLTNEHFLALASLQEAQQIAVLSALQKLHGFSDALDTFYLHTDFSNKPYREALYLLQRQGIKNSHGYTTLIYFSIMEDTNHAFLLKLIEKSSKAVLDLQDLHGFTATAHACLSGNLSFVTCLAMAGADVVLPSPSGTTPLHRVLNKEKAKFTQDDRQIVEFLWPIYQQDQRKPLLSKGSHGKTPYEFAKENGHSFKGLDSN